MHGGFSRPFRLRVCGICTVATARGSVVSSSANCDWMSDGRLASDDEHAYASLLCGPDGPGAARAKLVIDGIFTVVGSLQTQRIVTWDHRRVAAPTLYCSARRSAVARVPSPNGPRIEELRRSRTCFRFR